MLQKERLEELIEQEATIWAVYDEDRIEKIKLVVRMFGVSVDEYNKLHDCEPMLYSKFCGIFRDICPISWVFETREEAEWHKEFGCIERTERLELPTWEEFDKKGYIEFVGKEATKLILEKTLTIDCDREPISYYVLEILVNDYDHRLLFESEYTKENYTLACRKAKELFLKGNVND